MRRDSFNVLFFIKKTKLLKNGEASVCMRITVKGARVETNIRKSIEPVSWNQAKECARGKSRKSTELNNYIEESRIKLHRIYTQLEENGELIGKANVKYHKVATYQDLIDGMNAIE